MKSDSRQVSLADSDDVVARTRALLPTLRPSDARVANVVLEHGERVGLLSITDVAAAARCAESTVVRACQRLGYRGFHDLKRQIAGAATAVPRLAYEETAADDDADPLDGVVAAGTTALSDALRTVDRDAFAGAVHALAAADLVLFVGVGPSSPLAQDAAYRFRMLGARVDAPVDALTLHLAARLLTERSVCVVVSHTGATHESMLCAQTAKRAGATTVAVTSVGRSPLTRIADHALVSGGVRPTVRVEAMASRFAHLAVLDALYVGVARRNPDRALSALDGSDSVAAEHQF